MKIAAALLVGLLSTGAAPECWLCQWNSAEQPQALLLLHNHAEEVIDEGPWTDNVKSCTKSSLFYTLAGYVQDATRAPNWKFDEQSKLVQQASALTRKAVSAGQACSNKIGWQDEPSLGLEFIGLSLPSADDKPAMQAAAAFWKNNDTSIQEEAARIAPKVLKDGMAAAALK